MSTICNKLTLDRELSLAALLHFNLKTIPARQRMIFLINIFINTIIIVLKQSKKSN